MTTQPEKLRILYVEDDEFQRQLISFLLKKEGFELKIAHNGREGVDLAQAWLPDLILMDLMMPVMDGFEATELLRADPRTSQTPIIALTATVDVNQVSNIQKVGMNGFISKTAPLPYLVESIYGHLDKNKD